MRRLLGVLFIWLWVTSAHAAIPNTIGWFSLAGTQVDNVCQFPAGPGNGCAMLTNDWNGALFDTKRNQMVFGWGGGHSDYFGNEIVALAIGANSAITDTQTLTRIRNSSPTPQSYTGFGAVTDTTSSIGISPVARHTYSNLAYLPDQDKYILLGGGSSPIGNMINDVWLWTPATNTYQQLANSPIDRSGGFFGSAPAWDGERHLLWVISNNNYYSFDPSSNTWTSRGAGHGGVDMANYQGAYDAVKRRHYIAGDGIVFYWDTRTTSAYVRIQPTLTGCAGAFTGPVGLQYDPVQDRIVAWHGGNTFYLLNTTTHICTTQTVTGGPLEVSNGTFSKFQYSAKDNLFVTCQASSSNCFAARLTVQSADTDFQRRANAPGVTYVQSFDNATDYTFGNKAQVGDGGFTGGITRDTTTKVSGTAALRFNLPAGRATSNISGSWLDFVKTGGGVGVSSGFTQGQTWYLQYRERVTPTMVSNLAQWQQTPGGTGWKSLIHHGTDGSGQPISCDAIELTNTTWLDSGTGTQIWYTECGNRGAYMDNTGAQNSGGPWIQQGSNLASKTDGFWCDFNNQIAGSGNGPGCWKWQFTNEWITYLWKVSIVNFTTNSGTIQVYMARDGASSYSQVVNMNGIYRFQVGSAGSANAVFNRVTFTPYMTNLSVGGAADANMWFDEFIVSTEPIPVPGQAAGGSAPPDTTPPSAPTGVQISKQEIR